MKKNRTHGEEKTTGRKAPTPKPKPIIPVDPERGQGYLNNAEQMLLDLFGDVRKLVNDPGLTGVQRISAAGVGLDCCEAMQRLKYPPKDEETMSYWCDGHGEDE